MFKRQKTGSVVCMSCGYLVGVNDEKCYHCGRRNPGFWGFAPALRSLGHDLGFVPFMTGTCIVVYVLTLLWTGVGAMTSGNGNLMTFLSPDTYSLLLFGASGSIPVFELKRWWTPLSATWLHGGVLHILFNVLWIRQLAPAVGELYGPGRMIIIYTIGGVTGFVLSSIAGQTMGFMPIRFLQGGQVTVGASAAIFGLLGAIVYYGRRGGSSMVGTQAWSWAIMMFVFGLIVPGVDNYAHAGGFLGGWVAGRLLDPLKQERIDHVLVALACLVLSLLSILWSIISGLMMG